MRLRQFDFIQSDAHDQSWVVFEFVFKNETLISG